MRHRHVRSLLLHLKSFIITVATVIIVSLAIVVVLVIVLMTIIIVTIIIKVRSTAIICVLSGRVFSCSRCSLQIFLIAILMVSERGRAVLSQWQLQLKICQFLTQSNIVQLLGYLKREVLYAMPPCWLLSPPPEILGD